MMKREEYLKKRKEIQLPKDLSFKDLKAIKEKLKQSKKDEAKPQDDDKSVGQNLSKATKSQYEEDVWNGNHESVWGSWWNEVMGWGYDCCHSNVKDSVCIGVKGKRLSLREEYQMKKIIQDAKYEQLKELQLNQAPSENSGGQEKQVQNEPQSEKEQTEPIIINPDTQE